MTYELGSVGSLGSPKHRVLGRTAQERNESRSTRGSRSTTVVLLLRRHTTQLPRIQDSLLRSKPGVGSTEGALACLSETRQTTEHAWLTAYLAASQRFVLAGGDLAPSDRGRLDPEGGSVDGSVSLGVHVAVGRVAGGPLDTALLGALV